MAEKTTKTLTKILIALFLLALLGLFAVLYLWPTLIGTLTRTSLAEYGQLRVTDEVTCYFVREETVRKAEGTGTIQYYFEEGELVRKGTKVADITPDGGSYRTDDTVVLSTYTDGLEEVFSPANLRSLRHADVEALDAAMADTRRETAAPGEPLYKTVKNGTWYAAFWVGQESIVKYAKGGTVTLQLPNGDVRCRTVDIIDDDGSWLILLSSDRYYEGLPALRKLDITVVTLDQEGLLIANSSLTSRDGTPGVMVRDIGGDFVFRPVSVLATDGQVSVVENAYFYRTAEDGTREKVETVKAFDEIRNDPERKGP